MPIPTAVDVLARAGRITELHRKLEEAESTPFTQAPWFRQRVQELLPVVTKLPPITDISWRSRLRYRPGLLYPLYQHPSLHSRCLALNAQGRLWELYCPSNAKHRVHPWSESTKCRYASYEVRDALQHAEHNLCELLDALQADYEERMKELGL